MPTSIDVETLALRTQVLDEVARRMPGQPEMGARVGRAVLAEAQLAGLDPLLVIALIHVKSAFAPARVSETGAAGLMQLREETLRRELARSGLGALDLLDPVTNVRAGIRYLRRLIDAFGILDVALMAYDAGPGHVCAHLRSGRLPDRLHEFPHRVRAEAERLRRPPRRRGGGGVGAAHAQAL